MATRYNEVHINPQGPGDARPTATQIIQDEQLEGKWNDKVIFITGASSGIGVETAKVLATTGATLYLTARNLDKARDAFGQLSQSPKIHLLELDLNKLSSVRSCAEAFLSRSSQLNILIHNAGVMATPEGRTADGFETQFGVNHLAHFLLFNLLKDVLLASSTASFNSRVVILSSIFHRFGSVHFDNLNLDGVYDKNVAYSQAKTAELWTANEIERRYGSSGLHAWSVQPGGINTGLSRHMSEEETSAAGNDPDLKKIFKSIEQGAATTVWAACASILEGRPGDYLEDCQIIGPWIDARGQWGPGYSAHAHSPADEARLWAISELLVGWGDTRVSNSVKVEA